MEHHRLAAIATAWIRSWRAGYTSFDHVLAALAERTEHRYGHTYEQVVVDAANSSSGRPGANNPSVTRPFAHAITELATVSDQQIRLVLPAPGDPTASPGPSDFTKAALSIGEGMVCGHVGLVPQVVEGRMIVWQLYTVDSPPIEHTTIAQATEELLLETNRVTTLLGDLDLTNWRTRLGTEVATLRGAGGTDWLPPGYGVRAGQLIDRAARVLAISAFAGRDHSHSGAINNAQATARAEALRHIASTARTAYRAAINAPLTG